MSRSTKTFPHYTKLEIDPEKWPSNYYSSSRFCEVCETHWPTSHLFTSCPICVEDTQMDEHNAPDMRWPDAVVSLLTSRFENFYDQYNEGVTDEQLAWEDVKKDEEYDFDQLEPELEKLSTKAA